MIMLLNYEITRHFMLISSHAVSTLYELCAHIFQELNTNHNFFFFIFVISDIYNFGDQHWCRFLGGSFVIGG